MQIISNKMEHQVKLEVDGKLVLDNARNHRDVLHGLLAHADEALFVSPFLYDDFEPLFSDADLNATTIELVSTCAPRGDDQFRKPLQLRSFGSTIQSKTGKWPVIGINQKLHSKIYVFSRDAKPFAGVVTSANLTLSGLSNNHETGVLITDPATLERLKLEARIGLDFVHLTEDQVDQLCAAAKMMAKDWHWDPEVEGNKDFGLGNILKSYCTPAASNRQITIRDGAAYYIKVSGVTDRPILPKDRRPFAEPRSELTFAKNPNKIRIGDCLLEVAVGGQCFLSYYSCASAVYERTKQERRSDLDMDRWPFYIYANNLSLHYGKNWFERPLHYADVIAAFKRQHPNTPVTMSGNDDIAGAIQWGHSYIAVTRTFGEFVRTTIDRLPLA